MTVCNQCNELFDGINDICPACAWENERLEAATYMLDDEDDEADRDGRGE